MNKINQNVSFQGSQTDFSKNKNPNGLRSTDVTTATTGRILFGNIKNYFNSFSGKLTNKQVVTLTVLGGSLLAASAALVKNFLAGTPDAQDDASIDGSCTKYPGTFWNVPQNQFSDVTDVFDPTPTLPNPARIEEISNETKTELEIPPKPPIEISETTQSESFITPFTFFGGVTLMGLLGIGVYQAKNRRKLPMTIEGFCRKKATYYDEKIDDLLALRTAFYEKYQGLETNMKSEDVEEFLNYFEKLKPVKALHLEAKEIENKVRLHDKGKRHYDDLDSFVNDDAPLNINDNLLKNLFENKEFSTTFKKEYIDLQLEFHNMLKSKPKDRKEALNKVLLREYLFNTKYSALEKSNLLEIKIYQEIFNDFRNVYSDDIEIASKALELLHGEEKLDIIDHGHSIAKWLVYMAIQPSVTLEMIIEETKLVKEKFHEFNFCNLADFIKILDNYYSDQPEKMQLETGILQNIEAIKKTITGLSIMTKGDIEAAYQEINPFLQLNNTSCDSLISDKVYFLRKSSEKDPYYDNKLSKKIITKDCLNKYENEFHKILKTEYSSQEDKLLDLKNVKQKFFEGLEEYLIEEQKIRLLKCQIDCYYKSDLDFRFYTLSDPIKEIDKFLESSYSTDNVELIIPPDLLTYPLTVDPFIVSCRKYFSELKSKKEKIEPENFFEIYNKFVILKLQNFELEELTAFSNLEKLILDLSEFDFSILDKSVGELFPFQKIKSNPQKAGSNDESAVNQDQRLADDLKKALEQAFNNPILINRNSGELVKKD